MSEKNPDGSDKVPGPDKPHDAMSIPKTIAEGQAEVDAANNPAPTAESLGVDQASFDKFHKDGQFNWEAYGKEQAFKAQQKATGEGADKKPDGDEKKPDPDRPKPPQHSDTQEAQDAVAKAGLDWDDLGSKIESKGDIDEGDYAALKNLGIPENIVKTYISSVKAESQGIIDAIIEGAGGQETFDKLFDVLHEKPLDLRNKIDGLLLDPDTRDAGIDLMFKHAGMERPAAHQATTGGPKPTTASTGANNRTSGSAPAGDGFASFEEQVAAQRDPRYKTDVNYRNEVMRKIGASSYEMNPRTHTGGL